MSTAVHKITLMVIDHEGFGADEVSTILANTRGVHANVISSESAEVEWSDGHPLNHMDKQSDAFAALFATPPSLPAAQALEGVEAVRAKALEEAAQAVEQHDRAGREWIPHSLWGQLSAEASARIRALAGGSAK